MILLRSMSCCPSKNYMKYEKFSQMGYFFYVNLSIRFGVANKTPSQNNFEQLRKYISSLQVSNSCL